MNQPTMTTDERVKQYMNFMPEMLTESTIISKLGEASFFEVPASIKHHGAYTGGLFDHSFAVSSALVSLTQRLELKWMRPESPYIVGMFHDLCKTEQYEMVLIENKSGIYADGIELGNSYSREWRYREKVLMPGHGVLSVILAQRLITLTQEEIVCIRWHMGAFENDTSLWNHYGAAIETYPNVLYSHTADMIASRVIGV